MKLHIDVIVEPEIDKTDEDEAYVPEVWPTMLTPDEPGIPSLLVEFYDGSTTPLSEDDHTWRTIRDWSQDVSVRDTITYTYKSGCWDFYFSAEEHKVNLVGNDPGPAESVIQSEYAENNKNRWKRMPLVNSSDSDQLGRASITSGPDCNLRLALVQKDRTVSDFSEDLAKDGRSIGGGTIKPPPDDDTGFAISFACPPKGTFGLKLTELGARFLNHYCDVNGKYVAQSVSPDSMYWKAFDTLDEDNFKVTQEPSYESDEVSGQFLNLLIGQTKLQVYLMPRDWAYTTRIDSYKLLPGQESPVVSTYHWHEEHGWIQDPEHPEYTYSYVSGSGWSPTMGRPPCVGEDFPSADATESEARAWLLSNGFYFIGNYGSGSGATCDWQAGVWEALGGIWENPPWAYYWAGCGWGGVNFPIDVGECSPGDHHLHFSIDECHSGYRHGAILIKYLHNLALIYQRPPMNFGPLGRNYWAWSSDDSQVFQHHDKTGLFGDEGLKRARDHRRDQLMQSQGMSYQDAQAQAEDDIVCGYTAYHCIIDNDLKSIQNNFKGDSADGWSEGAADGIRMAIALRLKYKTEGSFDFSSFWQQFGVPDGSWWISNGYMFDYGNLSVNQPMGVGICPTKAKSLCAIIRMNDAQVYYVWRKTDEDFEVANLGVVPNEKPPETTFPAFGPAGTYPDQKHSAIPVYPLWHYSMYTMNGGECQFWGSNGAVTGALVPYQVSCVNGVCTSMRSGGAGYTLPIKVYPLYPQQKPPQGLF